MSSFSCIPICAMFAYVFLFLALMAAKKDKIINGFLFVLVASVLWTGGSFFMRIQLWPSIKFWYDISILGLTLLPYSFLGFISDFVGSKNKLARKLWLIPVVLVNVLNITKELILKHPMAILSSDGSVYFVYETTWRAAGIYVLCAFMIIHMFLLICKFGKNNGLIRKQLQPIIVGIIILFIGNVLILFPFFKGFPVDILAGVVNAGLMFYALYRRHLFRLTLLVSRGACYFVSTILCAMVFSTFVHRLEHFIDSRISFFAVNTVLIIAVSYSLFVFFIYFISKKFIDHIFIKEEIAQAENLKNFSFAVSKSLNVDEILNEFVSVIQTGVSVRRVYVCIEDFQKSAYRIIHSTSPLDAKDVILHKTNPLVMWMTQNDGCLLMKDFKRTIGYKSMWEEEKRHLSDLRVECFVPLKDEDNLIGIVLLSGKDKNGFFSYDDINFLNSVNSIGSIAVKNSRLYEKAYQEARTDELTGLLNRKYFYEVLNEEFGRNKSHSLALIILNIDDFKLYNQLYGMKEGDIALQRIAEIIKASVGNHGYVARYSGKEFAIILPDYDLLSANTLAETIRKQILQMNKKKTDYALKVLTVSGGVCSIPYAASNVRQLIDNADMAVYNVKRNGKNAIKVYSLGEKESIHKGKDDLEEKESVYSEYASTIYALTAAIDTKDHYTFSHSKNVENYATKLAEAAGQNQEFVEIVREAALLHDIGKIGIPEHILNKPGKLTPEEYEIMKTHVENSIGIIRYLPSLDYVIPAVIGHHERYDGNGYPRRIAGEDIPLAARILCVADSFDAMTSVRSYKEAFPVEKAVKILLEEAGKQFDRDLVHLFVDLVERGEIKLPEKEE